MRCVCLCFLLLLLPTLPCGQSAQAALIVDGSLILRTIQEKNLCAITFDDGPSRHTPQLLDILKERGIPATFFVVGTQVRYHPRLVQRMQAEGHEIGNHTATHASLRHRPLAEQRTQILSVQDALQQLGVISRYIRPPYGRYDPNTIALAEEAQLGIVLWSVDSMDWMQKAQFDTLKSLSKTQKDRGIFLFHDTHAPTIQAMPAILDRLIQGGCRFVTISEFLEEVDGPTCPRLIQVEKQPETTTAQQNDPYQHQPAQTLPATGSIGAGGTNPVLSSQPAQTEQPDVDPAHKNNSQNNAVSKQNPTAALGTDQDFNEKKSDNNKEPVSDFLNYFKIRPLSSGVQKQLSEEAA